MQILEIKKGRVYRLNKRFLGVPAGTPLKLLIVNRSSVTVEFACLGRLILRNRIVCVPFNDCARYFKPARSFSFDRRVTGEVE